MSIEMVDRKEPRIIKADLSLQKKVGNGPLDETLVERCQKVIDTNVTDFEPLALEYIAALRAAIAAAKKHEGESKDLLQGLSVPVMQLKAHAALFGYKLISNLAAVMLSFLETVPSLDSDVIEIVSVHEKTLALITAQKMKGDGGKSGHVLEEELRNACSRYFAKKGV